MVRRPIFGFGWGGKVAVLILLALCCALASGIDLRYQLMRGLLEAGGIGPVYWLASVALPAHHFAATDPMFSLVTVALLLPVLHRLPRRGLGWRAAVVGAWGLAGPVVWFLNFAGLLPLPFYGASGATGAAVNNTVITAVVLWAVTGGWVTPAASLLAAVVLWTMYQNEVPIPIPGAGYFVFSAAWHAVVIGAAWFECWRLVRRLPGPADCPHCGYDLAGVTAECPECGRARAAAA